MTSPQRKLLWGLCYVQTKFRRQLRTDAVNMVFATVIMV